jgi:hypothetical protein
MDFSAWPELSIEAEDRLGDARILAVARVDHARQEITDPESGIEDWDYYSIDDDWDDPYEEARTDVAHATTQLFDAYAEEVWEQLAPDLKRFCVCVKLISSRVLDEIACPPLHFLLGKLCSDRGLHWITRATRQNRSLRGGGAGTNTKKPVMDAKPPQGRRPSKAGLRKALVLPILEKHGWSILDWANESGVAYHTASNYLDGSTNPYRSTRVKLATGLGIDLAGLPE